MHSSDDPDLIQSNLSELYSLFLFVAFLKMIRANRWQVRTVSLVHSDRKRAVLLSNVAPSQKFPIYFPSALLNMAVLLSRRASIDTI